MHAGATTVTETSSTPPIADGAETIETRFGSVAIRRQQAVHFPEGLLGMPDMQAFCLAELPSAKMRRFKLLQCLSDLGLGFIVLPVVPDGGILAENDVAEAMDAYGIAPEDVAVLLIVSVHRSPEAVQLSVNARAPLLIDTRRKTAWQHVFIDEKYQVRHLLSNA